MDTRRTPAAPLGPVDLLLAEAAHDPRMRPRPFNNTAEETVRALTALREAMQLRHRRALPAAPRRPQLQPGPPHTIVMVDEAELLIGQVRSGKQSPEAARLIREILAAGPTRRINGDRRLPKQ
ncbi:hypothetical protein ACIG0C_30245 [Kitasatospora aureofaciens]|uniref:Uncharacterized protein n=1 Tax=Kitasatospora aureofaciens TaxID=1894 RepID=A0A1E7NE66_KITAU|nr:hypothetical protein [Kitasatospora aureofaciens]ARF83236.1 hypothetical protein B6264_30315 [Kitasatospora aureofaciens]OEV39006.1 hypothetical protein HS99_0018045 [Kitasatospora aureofaciens]GGU99473.1 hypothetical protein GCM10010502_62430 [Kitasatospora aureofaciens]